MVHCCVRGCNSRSERKTENITFHTFPKNDIEVSQLWIQATGRQNWEPTKYTRICSRHFEENCFRKTQHMTYLNACSVPTLYVVELGPASSEETSATNVVNLSTVRNVTVRDKETYQIPLLENSTSTEAMDFDTSSVPRMEKPSTSTQAMDLHKSSDENQMSELITPRKKKLVKQLGRQTLLAQTRKRKLVALRSKYRRLEKKNAELSAIIEQLCTRN